MARTMNNMLLAVLGLMALSANISTVSASAITTLDSLGINRTSNGTIAVIEGELTPCHYPENNSFRDKCYCFGDVDGKYGIDRSWLVTAIDNACSDYFTGDWDEPLYVYGWSPEFRGSYTYTMTYPPKGDTEEGKVVISLIVDTFDDACKGPLYLDLNTCWNTYHMPIDDCNVARENGKHAGIYRHGCFWWIVDPAPSHNQPYHLDQIAGAVAAVSPAGTNVKSKVKSREITISGVSAVEAYTGEGHNNPVPFQSENNSTPAPNNLATQICFLPCAYDTNDGFSDRCYCWERTEAKWGVDRHWIITAMNAACNAFTGGIGDPVAVYGWGEGYKPSYKGTYTYPASHPNEAGVIELTVFVDRTNPECAGPIPLTWGVCWDQLHTPLDTCDNDGENGKNGGLHLNGCFWWIVDPNPGYNQPYPLDQLKSKTGPGTSPLPGLCTSHEAGDAALLDGPSDSASIPLKTDDKTYLFPRSMDPSSTPFTSITLVEHVAENITFDHSAALPPLLGSCNYPENVNNAADNCFCFGNVGYGVDRHWIINAITFSCGEMTGGIGDPVSVYGLSEEYRNGFTALFTYPSTHANEDGKIALSIFMDRDNAAGCAGPVPVSPDMCWDFFHKPLDFCDMDGENGKHGGYIREGCVWFVVDPEPSRNWPYAGIND